MIKSVDKEKVSMYFRLNFNKSTQSQSHFKKGVENEPIF